MGPSPVHTGHQAHNNQPVSNSNQSSLMQQNASSNKTSGAVSPITN